jgi:hypothetical protein
LRLIRLWIKWLKVAPPLLMVLRSIFPKNNNKNCTHPLKYSICKRKSRLEFLDHSRVFI